MDIFSGSIPRKFIPLRLEIPNEENEEPTNEPDPKSSTNQAVNQPDLVNSPAPTVSSSKSPDEDVTAYADKMAAILEEKHEHSAAIIPQGNIEKRVLDENTPGTRAPKRPRDPTGTSESEGESVTPSQTGSASSGFPQLLTFIDNPVVATDNSDGESSGHIPLYGVGTGSSAQHNLPSSSFLPQLGSTFPERGDTDDEAEQYRRTVLTNDREMCASARVLMKKHFAENDRFNLPPGHPAVVFSEPQMYGMLRAVSDESVMSMYYLSKNLARETAGLQGPSGSRHQQRTASFRKQRVPVGSITGESSGESDGKGDEPSIEDDTTGTLHTSDEAGSVSFIREKVGTDQRGFQLPGATSSPISPIIGPLASPGGTSTSSTQTLAVVKERVASSTQTLQRLPEDEGLEQSVGAKRVDTSRSKPPKPAKVLKPSYSKGMTWTRTFVCGPKDPLQNKYKFYCQLCKVNLSCQSKGALEVLRHHKTEKHLRRDQRWRYEHLKTVNPVSGKVNYEVRDKYGRILDSYQLAQELPKFIDTPLVDLGPKFPFYDEVVGETPEIPADVDHKVHTQLSLIATFLVRGGDFPTLQQLWTRAGIFGDQQGAFAEFDWGKRRILVSHIYLSFPVL